jgi:hypothetical protein
VLRNWLSDEPLNHIKFDIKHEKYHVEIQRLSGRTFQVIGDIYVPAPVGLAVMVALKVRGSMTFAGYCAKAYEKMRSFYQKYQHTELFHLSTPQNFLGVDADSYLKVLRMLEAMNVCIVSGGTLAEYAVPSQGVLLHRDFWAALQLQLDVAHGGDPFMNKSVAIQATPRNIIEMCSDAFENYRKAHERMMTDPAGALTSSRAMLESAIKWILHEHGQLHSTADGNLGTQLKQCLKVLGLTDKSTEKPGVADFVRGLVAAVSGLGTARNEMGDGHGASPTSHKPNVYISQFAVEAASSLTTFLLNTHNARNSFL